MKRTRSGLGLVLGVGLTFAAVACGDSQDAPPLDIGQNPTGDGRAAGVGPETEIDPFTKTPDVFVPEKNPRVLLPGADPVKAAQKYLEDNRVSLGITDTNQLKHEQTVTEDGIVHVGFQQMVNNIPVFGVHVGVHFNEDGEVAFVDGPFVPGLEALASTAPKIDEATAFATATQAIIAEDADATSVEKKSGALAIYYDEEDGMAALAWRFNAKAMTPDRILPHETFVDAITGELVENFRDVATAMTDQATVQDTRGNALRIPVYEYNGAWEMGRPPPNALVVGRLNRSETRILFYRQPTAAGPWDAEASEALFNVIRVSGFYVENFKWQSFDDRGSDVGIIVKSPPIKGLLNAAAFDQYIEFTVATPEGPALTRCLDVIGHEYQHLVTANTSRTKGKRRPGMINEAVSDVFSAILEHEVREGPENFTIGEESIPGGLRNYLNPGALGHPAHWSQRLPMSKRKDKEGDKNIHANASIIDNAFALMTVSGTNPTSNIAVANGIGWSKSRRLFWHTIRSLIHEKPKLAGMGRRQTLLAKRTKSFGIENAKSIACAWRAVGILKSEQVFRYVGEDCAAPVKGVPMDWDVEP